MFSEVILKSRRSGTLLIMQSARKLIINEYPVGLWNTCVFIIWYKYIELKHSVLIFINHHRGKWILERIVTRKNTLAKPKGGILWLICIFTEGITKLNASYYFSLKSECGGVPALSTSKKQEFKDFHRPLWVLLNPNPCYAQLGYLRSEDWLYRRHVIQRLSNSIFI